MSEKVSIVIPVYNSEAFLEDCVECILNQTYKNIEIILIDDGSTDNSYQILEILQKDHPSIIRIYHQENMGTGATRNRGILYAVGTYLMFADNDDTMSPDYIETMVNLIKKTDSDMVVGGCHRVTESGKTIFKHRLNAHAWSKFRMTTPWGRIMRTRFVLENHLKFGEFVLGEDAYFTISAYNASPKIVTTDYIGYHWVDHPKSVSNTVQKQAVSDPFPLLEGLLNRNEVCRNITKNELDYFIIKYLMFHLTHIAKTVTTDQLYESMQQYFEWLDSNLPGYMTNQLLGVFSPKGEQVSIRLFVWLMVKMSMKKKRLLMKFFKRFS
ncbi:glycosyltransferase family 2 protein [Anaerosacchariphilus polymeriproducens]|uniref:Glycosyltransferase family 2 protein n=1 Tax=Anaerosacchariphilus polymeriproducens TaxID=1812858 RepID=A0A371AY65_9FIRM|nr:glycosyltransferase family A protein [Anaerosacchariphilus polymeriproducens]RDU24430.1 glycosyltransferase family 2 protein [Anaerosacchariphilus polymeriproducens]